MSYYDEREREVTKSAKAVAIGGGAKVEYTEKVYPNVTEPPSVLPNLNIPKWLYVILAIYLLGNLALKITGQVHITITT